MAPDGRAGGWGPVVPGVCMVHRLVLTPTTVTALGPHAALCALPRTIKFLWRWFGHLVKIFIKHGLKPTVVDPCLFVLSTMAANGFRIKCGTHVDDFLFTTNDWEQFSAWVDGVNKDITFSRFDSIEKGEDYMSLWLTYDRAKSYLQISQSSYIKKALKTFGL